jgi:hypothetical protein
MSNKLINHEKYRPYAINNNQRVSTSSKSMLIAI